MYEADPKKHQYKFYSFINSTAGDGFALYPQFMYESILKVATQDDDFEFKVRNTPYPITNETRKRERQGISAIIIFLIAIAQSLLLTSIIGQIVYERIVGIKHMQMISGLNLGAYWAANFVVDLAKMELV